MSRKLKQTTPLPSFDTLANIAEQRLPNTITLTFAQQDFKILKDFLLQYIGCICGSQSWLNNDFITIGTAMRILSY